MFNVYLCLRYIVFGIFIASNAIIASVGVWNLSLLQTVAMNFPVVSYLISVGAFGLAFIFTVIFIELAQQNPVTSHVAFECGWVSLFFVLELAGAAAFSALVPITMCSGGVEKKIQGSCISSQVLQAFTCIAATTLFGYLLVLLVSCFVRRQHGSAVWRCNVYDLSSLVPPLTPTISRFINRSPTIVAPKPRRPVADFIYSYRSGLSPEYEIEYYQPPVPPRPVASSSTWNAPMPNFYPQAVQSSLIAHPQPAISQSPPPLGNWPRIDVLQQPVRPRGLPTSSERTEALSSSPPRRRPTGPRNQVGSTDERRPPPLDLSKITSFKDPPRQ